ncbi:hypothetical protein Tco_0606802 [Tanacetum coccineum]
MEAHLAPKLSIQVNKIASSCEICGDPHDTQYCMENSEQAFVDYASSRTNEAGEARLSKFEADFKQQQRKMTNKIDTFLKAINDRMTGALPSDIVKNMKLSDNTYLVLSALECKMIEEEGKEEKSDPETINTNPPSPHDSSISFITKIVCKLNSFLESINLVPRSSDVKSVCIKDNDGHVMFIEIVKKYDDPSEEELGEDENTIIGGLEIEYFDIFPTRSELAYLRVVRFTNGIDEITYKMPHKIEQYNSLSDLEKEHTKSVNFRNKEDKKRGVDYVMSKILGFYKECLELGPEYLTGLEDEGGVT